MFSRLLQSGFVLTALLITAACSDSSTGPDPAGPALLSITPQGGAVNVGRSEPMVMQFDGAMAAGMEAYVDMHRGDLSGPMHPMTCTWSQDRTTLTCQLNQAMDPQTGYVMHMGGGLRGMNGRMADVTRGGMMGGETLNGGMMHDSQSMGMRGDGWKGPNGSYGTMFRFRTGN